MKVKTRFAPSPTGILHVGNARTALINMLYARHFNGSFILRIDDTDLARSKKEYTDAIKRDLLWLQMSWDAEFSQSSRLKEYDAAKQKLIASKRLYECFETPEELEIKRKLQLSSGRPPIYDRVALKLSDEQKEKYKKEGRKPHYRFKLEGTNIEWNDLVKGQLHFEVANISDPIVIREDGTMTYMICSTVDDIDYDISHVIRGEDHVTNTAIQIQIFEALGAPPPAFGHLSLVKAKEDKISKRVGGFEISSLREDKCLEAMAINSFFANIGTSKQIHPYKDITSLAQDFDITKFSTSPTTYIPEDLERLNHKLLLSLKFEEVRERLKEIGASEINKDFWEAVRPNLRTLLDAKVWWEICHKYTKVEIDEEDREFLILARALLPAGEFTSNIWKEWTYELKKKSERYGKSLFMPLRYAITGMKHGPELADLLSLIGRDEILSRLELCTR